MCLRCCLAPRPTTPFWHHWLASGVSLGCNWYSWPWKKNKVEQSRIMLITVLRHFPFLLTFSLHTAIPPDELLFLFGTHTYIHVQASLFIYLFISSEITLHKHENWKKHPTSLPASWNIPDDSPKQPQQAVSSHFRREDFPTPSLLSTRHKVPSWFPHLA